MIQKTFTLIIAKVNEQLFHGEAHSVTLPSSEGEITVLAHHTPLIATHKAGTITVGSETGKQEYVIEKGILEISNNSVTVLV